MKVLERERERERGRERESSLPWPEISWVVHCPAFFQQCPLTPHHSPAVELKQNTYYVHNVNDNTTYMCDDPYQNWEHYGTKLLPYTLLPRDAVFIMNSEHGMMLWRRLGHNHRHQFDIRELWILSRLNTANDTDTCMLPTSCMHRNSHPGEECLIRRVQMQQDDEPALFIAHTCSCLSWITFITMYYCDHGINLEGRGWGLKRHTCRSPNFFQ